MNIEEKRQEIDNILIMYLDTFKNLEVLKHELDSQGVRIVDEETELPQVTMGARSDHKWVSAFTCAIAEMIKAGFHKTYRLVKE